jgi:hypothetical protein
MQLSAFSFAIADSFLLRGSDLLIGTLALLIEKVNARFA